MKDNRLEKDVEDVISLEGEFVYVAGMTFNVPYKVEPKETNTNIEDDTRYEGFVSY